MYIGLKHLHSYLPYLILLSLVVSVVIFMAKRMQGGTFTTGDRRLALITLILAHLQLVIGLVLYAISPLVKAAYDSDEMMSDSVHRFYAVEHFATMLIAIILITVGYSRAKRRSEDAGKFRSLSFFYLLGLALILLRIPWDVWPA